MTPGQDDAAFNALTFSFHVESADEIRCYLHAHCQLMCFLPQEMVGVVPKFFDLKLGKNAQWATSKRATELVEAKTWP